MKKILVSLLAILICSYCYAQNASFRIEGSVENDYEGQLYLTYGKKVDSASVKNNSFLFKGNIDYPVEAGIHTKGGVFNGYFFLENSDMKISLTAGKVTSINTISGNSTVKMMYDFMRFFSSLESDPNLESKLYNKMDSIIKSNPKNQLSGLLLSEIAMDPILTYEQIYALYSNLDSTTQQPQINKSLKLSLEKLKTQKIGARFEPIEAPDINGQLITTSDYDGKILLVDFWASWCKPCRQVNPQLVELYNKYLESGFQILGVSIDKGESAWKKAIERDGLVWKQTRLMNGWDSPIMQKLGIQYIPSNYLIDREGNILAINIQVEEIKTKLEGLLD